MPDTILRDRDTKIIGDYTCFLEVHSLGQKKELLYILVSTIIEIYTSLPILHIDLKNR